MTASLNIFAACSINSACAVARSASIPPRANRASTLSRAAAFVSSVTSDPLSHCIANPVRCVASNRQHRG